MIDDVYDEFGCQDKEVGTGHDDKHLRQWGQAAGAGEGIASISP